MLFIFILSIDTERTIISTNRYSYTISTAQGIEKLPAGWSVADTTICMNIWLIIESVPHSKKV